MRDAAVGFQCPSCVNEGSRSTRSGRTAYGGLRPGNAGLTSMVLIGINAAVWLLIMATGGTASACSDRLVLLPTGRCVPADSPGRYFHSGSQRGRLRRSPRVGARVCRASATAPGGS